MPIYISQGRYTREAIKGMIGKPEDRSEAVGKLLKNVGGKLLSYYVTFGEYDFLLVCEAPNEQAMASAVLAAAAGGGVSDLRTTVALTGKDAKAAFGTAGGSPRRSVQPAWRKRDDGKIFHRKALAAAGARRGVFAIRRSDSPHL